MSRIVTEVVEAKSDLTGKAATEVRSLTINGVTAEVDLTESEAATFDKSVGKYVAKAHTITVDPDVLRGWARANGIDVGERGRLSSELTDAFIANLRGEPAPETVDA